MTDARVSYIEPGTRPELAALEKNILSARGRITPLYQVLLHSVPVAEGWERFLGAIRNDTSLAADLRELVILRVAVLNRAAYEFDAHVPHAERAGVSPGKIQAVREPGIDAAFSPLEALVLELTDTVTQRIEVPDELFDRVRRQFDVKGIVDLVATIAAYNMVSRFLVALRIGH